MLLVLMTSIILCQSYNNEWIDFSKTYLNFKVAKSSFIALLLQHFALLV
jgi:hypothetical protein